MRRWQDTPLLMFCVTFSVYLACGTSTRCGRSGRATQRCADYVDDQGWGETGYNGHPHLKAPVLDEIAATASLDRFYAASPVCTPTRASVMTGRMPIGPARRPTGQRDRKRRPSLTS